MNTDENKRENRCSSVVSRQKIIRRVIMKKTLYYTFVLLITAVVTVEMSPRPAGADDGAAEESKPIRLRAIAGGPIGKIAMSFYSKSALAINGREVQGEHFLWGGELVQAPLNRSILVSFDSIGKVTLTRGAVARFATARGESGGAEGPVLVASLLAGNMRVRLEPRAGAFVQAADSTFAASQGASFNLGVNEGEAALDTFRGTVSPQQQPAQRKYIVRPVGLGSNISVRVRSTRQIQVQVTDENDRPVPDLPVIFLLGGGGGQFSGSLTGGTSVTVRTDAQGRANTSFTAGPSAGSNTISAIVEATKDTWTGTINVVQGGFWTLRNSMIVTGVAAAAVGAGVAVSAAGDNSEPLRPLPPPDVRP
jgi:hypothetical protein